MVNLNTFLYFLSYLFIIKLILMMKMPLEELKKLIIDLGVNDIGNAVQTEISSGANPQDILQTLSKGLDEVGELYEKNEYFLTDLILAGETMKEAMKILEPYLTAEKEEKNEKVIVCTVKGDNHDIGKNILKIMLISAGFEVIDLGINCSEKKIVKTVKKSKAKVVALSSLLTMSLEEISVVNKALKDAGLRDKIKMIVGGAPLDMELAKKLGSDDFANDAIEGVRHIKNLIRG